jgi:hypothetical protein
MVLPQRTRPCLLPSSGSSASASQVLAATVPKGHKFNPTSESERRDDSTRFRFAIDHSLGSKLSSIFNLSKKRETIPHGAPPADFDSDTRLKQSCHCILLPAAHRFPERLPTICRLCERRGQRPRVTPPTAFLNFAFAPRGTGDGPSPEPQRTTFSTDSLLFFHHIEAVVDNELAFNLAIVREKCRAKKRRGILVTLRCGELDDFCAIFFDPGGAHATPRAQAIVTHLEFSKEISLLYEHYLFVTSYQCLHCSDFFSPSRSRAR